MRDHFMSRFVNQLGRQLRIGLSNHGVALMETRGIFRARCAALSERETEEADVNEPEKLAALLRGALQEGKFGKMPATVVLDDALTRMWMVKPPQNPTQLSDCEAAAAQRFSTLYGESPAAWKISADWNASRPFLACAIPLTLEQLLRQVAHEHGLTLIDVVPHFVSSWNRWHAQLSDTAWFGILHDDVLTVAAIHEGQLQAIRTEAVATSELNDSSWLPAHLAREAMRLNLPAPDRIRLCGAVPAGWLKKTESFHCVRLDASLRLPVANPSAIAVLTASGLQ